MHGAALFLTVTALSGSPAEGDRGHYVAIDHRGAEARVDLLTMTVRGEAGRRIRLAFRNRRLVQFRQPFSPPPEREPEVRVIDLPLDHPIVKELTR